MKIGLVAPMRGGKDTFGEVLVAEYGYTRVAFADAVKEVSAMCFPEECKTRATARPIWQGVGNLLRQIDKDVWVNMLGRKVDSLGEDANIVVTDVRYFNEVEYLKSKGFTIIQILVDRDTILERCKVNNPLFKEELLNHESEQLALNNIVGDICIINRGSLTDYKKSIHKLIGGIEDGNNL